VKKWGARKITHCKKENFPDRLYDNAGDKPVLLASSDEL
jgi:hypothetical protein